MRKLIALAVIILSFCSCKGQDKTTNSWTAANLKGRVKSVTTLIYYEYQKINNKYVKAGIPVRTEISFSEKGFETAFKTYVPPNGSLANVTRIYFENDKVKSVINYNNKEEVIEKWDPVKLFKNYFIEEANGYNAENKLIKKLLNKFNEDGDLLSQKTYDARGYLLSEVKSEYNNDGTLKKAIMIKPKQKPEHFRYEYTKLDDKLNWIEMIETSSSGKLSLSERELIYY
jgi:hypothetical protein